MRSSENFIRPLLPNVLSFSIIHIDIFIYFLVFYRDQKTKTRRPALYIPLKMAEQRCGLGYCIVDEVEFISVDKELPKTSVEPARQLRQRPPFGLEAAT